MNNFNKKQKTTLIIAISIIIIVIFYYLNIKEQNNFSQIEESKFETIQNENLDGQSKVDTNNSEDIIKVHISGAVNKEGVVELKINSRISDAIDKAEGLKNDAYIDQINLAYILEDGMKIYIPNINEKDTILNNKESLNVVSSSSGVNIETQQNNQTNNKSNTKKININTATQAELETLPGIGPSTALKIITYRKENGKFQTIDDIQKVNGIGTSKFSRIKDLIEVK